MYQKQNKQTKKTLYVKFFFIQVNYCHGRATIWTIILSKLDFINMFRAATWINIRDNGTDVWM